MADTDNKMEKIVSLTKRRGFIFPGSEIYGGLAGTYDYGPLGVMLRDNILRAWWEMFVTDREDMYGLNASILMNERVWEASGHTGAGFADPLVICKECGNRQRVDKIVDEEGYRQAVIAVRKTVQDIPDIKDRIEQKNSTLIAKNIKYGGYLLDAEIVIQIAHSIEDFERYIGPHVQHFLNLYVPCPICSKNNWSEPRQFNLMFETKVGAEGNLKSFLRPETAQGIFVNFKNMIDSMSPKIPFGIAQIGKAFRNEIAPRDFLFRVREFEQMEIEYFVRESDWEKTFEEWREFIWKWFDRLGLSRDNVREFEVPQNDLAHYSKRTIDFEYNYPGKGWSELSGFAYRTDHDLKSHMEASGVSLEYIEPDGTRFVPHVLEPSFGLGRAITAVLAEAYTEDEMGGDARTYLRLPAHLAPYRVAVSPLLRNKPELVEKAREVYRMLKKEFGNVAWDDNGNIGKRYRRQDEIGTPYCVVIDFDTLGENPSLLDTVTVRDRDTGEQQRVAISELTSILK